MPAHTRWEIDTMGTKLAALILGLGLVVAGTWIPLEADHAFAAEFDAKEPIEMSDTVTRVQWIKPHVWVHIAVKMPDGRVENWAFEAGTPNNLFRRGFNKN